MCVKSFRGLLSVDTIKLDFMGIRETQQQQNFGF